MTIERKFIDLKDLKVSDDGPGFIEGYRSVFGEIDEGGDIVVKGFFADGISDYLQSGFTAHSHDWTFSEAVGFPVDAKEDDYGFFVKSQFHSTPDSQNVRTKAKERQEAGKTVGFSFGYAVKEKQYIEAKDYKEQLPQFIKPERLAANLKKAQEFSRIRILLKGETIEDSLVTSPMQKLAMATSVKSASKGMLAEELAQNTPSFWQTESAFCRIVKKIGESAKNSSVTGVEFDWRAKIAALGTEYGIESAALATAQIEEFLDSSDDEFYLKGISEAESFESFETVEAVVKKFTDNMKRNHENRTKEGRMLSGSNRTKVQAAYDALGELLAASEPVPKEKGIDVSALRTQSLRLRSQVSRTLAHLS